MEVSNIFSKLGKLVYYPLFEIRGHDVSLSSLILMITLLWGFSWLSKWVERFIHKALLYKDVDPGIKGSIERFSRYGVIIVGAFISLSTIGINLSSLTALGAVVGVGIGFGLQNITQNFISGIIILLERPIKKGDIVHVKGISGRVLDIKARSTLILTRDDIVIIVPNSQFITEQVINDSFSGDKLRMHIRVGVAYGSDVEKVTEVLMSVAKDHDKVLQTPPPTVTLDEFGDSSLNFSLRVWTPELWFSDIVLSEIRYEITHRFAQAGVTIPFPQRDLHIKTMVDPAAPPFPSRRTQKGDS
ncbi:MAG: mechanosensitive ion channel [Bdellovibrionales bacterium]|nr:mechanosensitive ion channel [Bdellovibrionales bacterium]